MTSGIITATGDLFPTITGMATAKGVAMNPPPDAILVDVTRMVEHAMQAVPANGKGALVGIATKDANGALNVNLALVQKVGARVNVVSWLGKSWGQPVSGGAAVQVHW